MRRHSPPKLVVRTADYAERKEVANLSKHSEYTKHFRSVIYCNRVRFESGNVIVAALGDTPVAFACIRYRKRAQEMELDILGTHPDYRDSGVGAAIVEYLKIHGTYGHIVLNVKAGNPDAVRFYKRCGFKSDPDLVMDGTAYRMRWKR